MADLIERDALEAKIRENSMRIRFFDPSVNVILHLIRYAPAVNRWIPVEDALPDGNRAVLVQYNEMYADGIHKQYAVAFYGKYTHHWIEPCSGQSLNVTKWQELDIQNEKE